MLETQQHATVGKMADGYNGAKSHFFVLQEAVLICTKKMSNSNCCYVEWSHKVIDSNRVVFTFTGIIMLYSSNMCFQNVHIRNYQKEVSIIITFDVLL